MDIVDMFRAFAFGRRPVQADEVRTAQWLELYNCASWLEQELGPPVEPCYLFFGEGSPTNIDHRKKGTLTSLLEDLGNLQQLLSFTGTFAHQHRDQTRPVFEVFEHSFRRFANGLY